MNNYNIIMDCIKLPFGYHNGYMLQNNRQKSDIISDIIEKYKLNIFTMYEKNYSDHLLDVIKTKNMIVCPITKGKPYILYMTKIHNENVSLFIDLEFNDSGLPKIISLPLSANDSLFNGTILYGELLRHKNNWSYLIESCKVYCGNLMFKKNNIDNLKTCSVLVKNNIRYNSLMPFLIQIKPFCSVSKIKYMINKIDFPVIGIKFLGLRNPITFYFNTKKRRIVNNNQIKLYNPIDHDSVKRDKKNLLDNLEKSNNLNNTFNSLTLLISNNIDVEEEFDLLLEKNETYGLYNLYCKDKTPIGIARVPTIELHNDIMKILDKNKYCSVSAYYNYNYNKWEITDIYEQIIDTSDLDIIQNHISILDRLPKDEFTKIISQ